MCLDRPVHRPGFGPTGKKRRRLLEESGSRRGPKGTDKWEAQMRELSATGRLETNAPLLHEIQWLRVRLESTKESGS